MSRTTGDPADPEPAGVRFGPFRFDEQTGELWRDDDTPVVIRLPPQPARLLSHLIDKRPQLVSRDEIRQLLWPDVAVEFEEGLHGCVRKIRAALDDSASDPQYVQTVPRRGYRFIGTVAARAGSTPRREARGQRRLLLGVIAAATLAIPLGLASFRSRATEQLAPTRIAVMPFEPPDPTGQLAPGNDMAESIVRILTGRLAEKGAVIGPTTTELYDGRPKRIRELIAELEIDYVVNGRESTGDAGPRVLVEIIRGSDGAHVWTSYLDELPAETAAEAIAKAAAESAR